MEKKNKTNDEVDNYTKKKKVIDFIIWYYWDSGNDNSWYYLE